MKKNKKNNDEIQLFVIGPTTKLWSKVLKLSWLTIDPRNIIMFLVFVFCI